MDADMVRRITSIERQLDRLKTLESGPTPGTAIAEFLSIPGLRAFWPMNDRSESVYVDLSGQGRHLTPTGSPPSGVLSTDIEYVDFNGTTQYLLRADEAGLDITGALTIGGWFRLDASGVMAIMSKWNLTGSQRSYLLRQDTGALRFYISTDGITITVNVTSSLTYTTLGGAGAWAFWAGRYTPSTELAIFVNDTKTINTTSIPASIYNSITSFGVGVDNGVADLLNGAAAFCFLSVNALADNTISRLFNKSRHFFGV